jgi:hypothetical protein
MQLARFIEPVSCGFKKSAGGITMIFEASRDYVLSTSQLERIGQDENVRARLYKTSRLEHRLQPFHALYRKPGGQRLLFYNGSGGYGDTIVSWPVAKWLSDQGYEVHVLVDPGNQACWYNFPWIKTIQVMPIAYESFKLFDHHFMMEYVNNTDEHQDQLHPVDVMFNHMGVDYRTIPPEQKVVEPVYTWVEQQNVKNICPDKPTIGIYQLAAANPVRCLQPNDSAFLLMRLAEATPEIHWLAIYDEFIPKGYTEALRCRDCSLDVKASGTGATGTQSPAPGAEKKPDCPTCRGTGFLLPNIQPYCSGNLRDLWALTKHRACVVVAPDSMMIHVAGCQAVPCVGLWGPVAPQNRAIYYRNHHAIFHREACPFSPCFAYTGVFPKYCPPRGNARTVCEVMAAVSPAEVIDAVKKTRRS